MSAAVPTRTPEGVPGHCPVCGDSVWVEPSWPTGDAPCPRCGSLVWFTNRAEGFEGDVAAGTRRRALVGVAAGARRHALITDWLAVRRVRRGDHARRRHPGPASHARPGPVARLVSRVLSSLRPARAAAGVSDYGNVGDPWLDG
jgi:hypothetical protein